ncbi:hypothetical protein DV738_g4004, partial [Chaetothyriales sp. CBS 135597]
MGTTHIEISHVRSRSPSVASNEDDLHDDLHENGVPVSPANASPQLSDVHPQSHSGSSHPSEFVNVSLPYPHELHDGDIGPADSASRIPAARVRTRPPREQPESPTESGTSDSAEDFLREVPGLRLEMPRSQVYYGQNGYTHSSSSGSYYPPNHMQVIPTQPPPQPHPYPPQPYPAQMANPPPPLAYPPTSMGYQPHQYPHHAPPSHMSSPPYSSNSAYGPPNVVPYGQPGYFPPQYGHQFAQAYSPYQIPPQIPPQIAAPMAAQLPPAMTQYQPLLPAISFNLTDAYRVHSPPLTARNSETARFEAMMKAQTEETKASQASKDEIMKEAAEQIKREALAAEQRREAEAKAAEQRREAEAKIREEARLEAIRAYEEKERAAAEQAAREKQIRQEAAEAALKAAAEEAAAKAERAALEKKIADDAAAAAKSEAEKAAADAAAAAKEAAEQAQKEAAEKLREAEAAAAKAKAEAEAAQEKAAAAKPPEKKKPVRFKDAIGRNYNFPFERCCRWQDMEGLINQAFQHIENLAEHVHSGHYDLLGPDKEIIMPQYWNQTIEPDMHITMMLWPLPEPKKEEEPEPIPPPLDDGGILNLDDLIGTGVELGVLVMSHLETPRDLFAFVCTARPIWQLFQEVDRATILEAVLRNAFPGENIRIAIAACEASQISKLWYAGSSIPVVEQSWDKFCEDFPQGCAPDCSSLSGDWNRLVSLSKLSYICDYFTACFEQDALSFAASKIPHQQSSTRRSMTSSERTRLQRAFLRFEIYRRVTPGAVKLFDPRTRPEYCHIRDFLRWFPPWEREEVLSVQEFLVEFTKNMSRRLQDYIALEISSVAKEMAMEPSQGPFLYDLRRMGYVFWDTARICQDWKLPSTSPETIELLPRTDYDDGQDWLTNEPGIDDYFKDTPIPRGTLWKIATGSYTAHLKPGKEMREKIGHGGGYPAPFSDKEAELFGIEY